MTSTWVEDKIVKHGWCQENITGFGDEEDCIVGPSELKLPRRTKSGAERKKHKFSKRNRKKGGKSVK